MPKGYAGQIVHVAYAGGCVAGIIVDPGRSARVRLFRHSGIRTPGTIDTEGDYRHQSDPMVVDTPDGGKRALPAWHIPQTGCEMP